MVNRAVLSILCLLGILVLSCENRTENTPQARSVADTICENQIKDAKFDFNEGRLVFCYYVGNVVWMPFRAEKEMDSLLKLSNIEYKNESSPCVIQPNRQYHCYCNFMQNRIDEKFGRKFTDSLSNIADKLYVLKHLDNVFDSWDVPPIFPGDSTFDPSNHSGLQSEFDRLVVYPIGYKIKQGENSYATLKLHVTINKNGLAKVTDSTFIFWDNDLKDFDDNKNFYNYFSRLAIGLVEKTVWQPAKIKSIQVKSESDAFIYLK